MAVHRKKPASLPRREQADATRRRLVQAALKAFSTRPFDAVAVDDIADAAGVAHGLVFHYFGSKRGLYLEALRDVVRQVLQLDPAHPALRLMLRALAGAIDEATVHWLTHARSLPLEQLIDALLEHLTAALRGAHRLDPTLDVTAALRMLAR